MISKEVLKVSKEISKFGANHVTVPIFASIVFYTLIYGVEKIVEP